MKKQSKIQLIKIAVQLEEKGYAKFASFLDKIAVGESVTFKNFDDGKLWSAREIEDIAEEAAQMCVDEGNFDSMDDYEAVEYQEQFIRDAEEAMKGRKPEPERKPQEQPQRRGPIVVTPEDRIKNQIRNEMRALLGIYPNLTEKQLIEAWKEESNRFDRTGRGSLADGANAIVVAKEIINKQVVPKEKVQIKEEKRIREEERIKSIPIIPLEEQTLKNSVGEGDPVIILPEGDSDAGPWIRESIKAKDDSIVPDFGKDDVIKGMQGLLTQCAKKGKQIIQITRPLKEENPRQHTDESLTIKPTSHYKRKDGFILEPNTGYYGIEHEIDGVPAIILMNTKPMRARVNRDGTLVRYKAEGNATFIIPLYPDGISWVDFLKEKTKNEVHDYINQKNKEGESGWKWMMRIPTNLAFLKEKVLLGKVSSQRVELLKLAMRLEEKGHPKFASLLDKIAISFSPEKRPSVSEDPDYDVPANYPLGWPEPGDIVEMKSDYVVRDRHGQYRLYKGQRGFCEDIEDGKPAIYFDLRDSSLAMAPPISGDLVRIVQKRVGDPAHGAVLPGEDMEDPMDWIN